MSFCSIKAKAQAEAVSGEMEGSSHSAAFSTVASHTGSGKGKKGTSFQHYSMHFDRKFP